MKGVELYGRVRYAVQIEGLSHREAARQFGIDPRTVAKMVKFSVPPGYVRKKPPARPKLDPIILVIDGILLDDKSRPKKQQHTALVHELLEARDEKWLLRLQRQLAGYKLLIIDELGYVPLSQTGAELLFEVFSQRYERGSTVVTSNLPFDEWTSVFGSERLTGALLDRLTHHVHILQMNGDSYRLNQSKRRQRQPP